MYAVDNTDPCNHIIHMSIRAFPQNPIKKIPLLGEKKNKKNELLKP